MLYELSNENEVMRGMEGPLTTMAVSAGHLSTDGESASRC